MSETKPPQVAMQDTLEHLLTQTQAFDTQLTAMAETLRTERCSANALTAALHRDVSALGPPVLQQAQQLDRLARGLAAAQAHRGWRRLRSTGSGFALGLGAMGLAWGLWPSAGPAAERLLTGVDQVLVQQWRTLPPPVQAHVTTVYSREGVVSPAHRQTSGGKL